jgi:hypothetical protein
MSPPLEILLEHFKYLCQMALKTSRLCLHIYRYLENESWIPFEEAKFPSHNIFFSHQLAFPFSELESVSYCLIAFVFPKSEVPL